MSNKIYLVKLSLKEEGRTKLKTVNMVCIRPLRLIHIILGAHGGHGPLEAPPMAPEIVRKFCCFDRLNGKSRRKRPMNRKIGLI